METKKRNFLKYWLNHVTFSSIEMQNWITSNSNATSIIFLGGGYKYKNINSVMSAPNKPYPPHPLPQKPPLIITWLRCYSYLTIYMEFHSSRPFSQAVDGGPLTQFLSPPISTECQKWSILAHIFFYSMYFFDILPINLSVCIYAEWCDKNPHSFTMANILPFFHTIFAQYGYAAKHAYRI